MSGQHRLVTQGTATRRIWNQRADRWHHQVADSPALRRLRDRACALAQPRPGEAVVDLGSGTGFLTLPIARAADSVLGVDVSPAMAQRLREEATRHGLPNVTSVVADLAQFDLPPDSVDVVVSMYALHHLTDADKQALVQRLATWLRPGGRVVVADMMFGRGGSRRDRRILWRKVRVLAAKGPAGLWRIAKNLVRFGSRVGTERPASPEFWVSAFRAAGLHDVQFHPGFEEAGIVTAGRPPVG
jgi:SAM-dependent methyltransferase